MSMMVNVFNPSLALLTDLYQLTMAYGYWKTGMADREAVFHVAFRKPPFGGGYAVACGLGNAIEYVKKLQFGDGDLFCSLPGQAHIYVNRLNERVAGLRRLLCDEHRTVEAA